MERRKKYGRKRFWEHCQKHVAGSGEAMGALGLPDKERSEIGIGARHNRVRHPRWSSRRHRDSGNHGVQAPVAGTLECHSRRHQRLVSRANDQKGQSTVEFAVVTAGFLAVTVALSAVWHALGEGLFVEHALAVASHHVQSVAPATLPDILLY